MSDLGSVGEGDVVLYDGLGGGEGEVTEVEGGQVLELSSLPLMEQQQEEDCADIASCRHSDVLTLQVWLVFIFSVNVKLY